MIRRAFDVTYKTGRRIVITIVGGTILLLGIVMLVTPGPGLIVIPIGLTILAVEFVWARHWLKKLRELISRRSAATRGDRAEQHRQGSVN